MKHYALFISAFLSCLLTYGQVYSGHLGKYPIHITVHLSGTSADAQYFYDAHLKDIHLEGQIEGTKLTLYKRYSTPAENQEHFQLQIDGQTLSGKWQNGDHTLPVKLKEDAEPWDDYKKCQLQYFRDSVSNTGDLELVWIEEQFSHDRLFRLGNGFSKTARYFLNPILDSIQEARALEHLYCNWAEFNSQPTYISDEYFSFSEASSTFCGGAHPNYGTIGYTFDLKTQKEISNLADIYPGLDLYQALKQKYEGAEGLQEECSYFEENIQAWKYAAWFLTENGAIVIPSYPHAMNPCREEFELTREELSD